MTSHGPGRAPRRTRIRRLDLRLLVPVLVAWPLTAFVALTAPLPLVLGEVVLLVAGVVGLLRSRTGARRPSVRLLALTLAAVAASATAAAGHRAVRMAGPVDELAAQHAVVTLRGTLASEPRVVAGRAGDEESGPRVIARLDVTHVDGRGRTSSVATPVLVAAGEQLTAVEWRSEVEVSGRLRPAEPGDDVVATFTAGGEVRVVDEPGAVLRVAEAVRERFRQATAHLPPDARGLVPALVIGDTSMTPPDLTEAMLDTGMSHLSAVSGSNVTLVLAAALGLCRLVLVPRRHRPWLALLVLVGFVVLARPEPSVIRAGAMGAVGLLGLSTRRRAAGIPALAGAMLVLMVWDPWLSRSYGFALSSVATLGLLVLAQPWGSAISRRLPRRLAWLGPVIAVPVAAQAVCAPIVVPLQSSVSLVAVPANLMAAPFVAPTTIVGVAVALASVVWVPAAALLAWLAALPALGIASVARIFAEVPYGSVGWDGSTWGAVGLGVLTLLVIGLSPWLGRGLRVRPLVALALALLGVAVAVPTSAVSWPPPGWLLVACDVGQGDGLVVNGGPGRAIVVDTGPDPGVMDACLRRLGVEVVDLVVLTHFHADHTDGLSGVLEDRVVREIRVSPVRDPPGEAAEVERLAAEAGIPVGELRAGDVLTTGALRADVWWPARSLHAGSVPNNGSVVMTMHTAGISVLFTGDIEREAVAEVLRAARREPVRWGSVDVLKVAHHGSANRDDRLLDHVTGRVALISVGVDNEYGHPAPSALNGLQHRGFRVHRTDLQGDIAVLRTPLGVKAVGREGDR